MGISQIVNKYRLGDKLSKEEQYILNHCVSKEELNKLQKERIELLKKALEDVLE